MKIVQDDNAGEVWISQPAYADKELETFGMQSARSVAIPVDPSTKLVKADESVEIYDQSEYQSAVGSLLYLPITRPDIMFAVSNVAKFCDPTKRHWTTVKRIFWYRKGCFWPVVHKHGTEESIGYSGSDLGW